jgi:hypothetical protein
MFSRRLHMQSHVSQLRSTKSGMSERIISMHSNMSANAGMSNDCKTSVSAGSGDKTKTNTATHKGVDGLITEFRTRTSAGISLKCAFRTRKTKCKASGYRDGAMAERLRHVGAKHAMIRSLRLLTNCDACPACCPNLVHTRADIAASGPHKKGFVN